MYARKKVSSIAIVKLQELVDNYPSVIPHSPTQKGIIEGKIRRGLPFC